MINNYIEWVLDGLLSFMTGIAKVGLVVFATLALPFSLLGKLLEKLGFGEV